MVTQQTNKTQVGILIEIVNNGFIITEHFRPKKAFEYPITAPEKKVFNTKEQLYNYIDKNL